MMMRWGGGVVAGLALAVVCVTSAAAVERFPRPDEFAAAVAAMRDGDTIWLDPHVDYFGPVDLRNKHCDVLGCAIRGQGGTARIWGMRQEADWQPAGGGRCSRIMRNAVDAIPTNSPDGITLTLASDNRQPGA